MKQCTQPFQGRFLGERTDNLGFVNPGLEYTIPSGLTSISRTLENLQRSLSDSVLFY